MLIRLIIAILLIFLSYNTSFALNSINKNLLLNPECYYLFCFDEKIINYQPNNNKIIRIESLSGIFNDKQELIVKPVKGINTNLRVQTNGNLYNFNILTNNRSKICDLSPEKGDLNRFVITLLPCPPKQNPSKPIRSIKRNYPDMDDLEIDKPPHLSTIVVDGINFDIDKPPGAN